MKHIMYQFIYSTRNSYNISIYIQYIHLCNIFQLQNHFEFTMININFIKVIDFLLHQSLFLISDTVQFYTSQVMGQK